LGETARLAVPIPDHFNPILYILGASDSAFKSILAPLEITGMVYPNYRRQGIFSKYAKDLIKSAELLGKFTTLESIKSKIVGRRVKLKKDY
jgi:hypothetical protein